MHDYSVVIKFITRIKTKNVTVLMISTVKPAHAVISLKQSPILKGHIFLVPGILTRYA
jgi:hypothetical protein